MKRKKLSDEMKEKIRNGRVKFLQENKNQHGAWNKSKKTYLEEWFDALLRDNEIYTKYNIKYNYSVYPYFLDFAFIDLMLDVEVDGKFHYTCKSNIEHDQKRNAYLEDKGWKVFRISIDEVNKNSEAIKEEFLKYLEEYNDYSISRYYTI